jgi:glycosyltransferase involved in cell wall biosynthesis
MAVKPVPLLLCVRTLTQGGTERQVAALAKALDPALFAPRVACFDARGFRAEELCASGIPIVEFPLTSFVRPSAISAALRFGRYLEENAIRIVHGFDYPANIFSAPVAKAFRTPVVLTSQRGYRTVYRTRYRAMLRMTDLVADGIVVNCEAMRRHLVDDYSVPPDKIHLCYNGLDPAFLDRPERARREPGNPLVVGTVTALRPEKGLLILMEGFAQARARRAGMRLQIVGSGPMLAELERASRELGVADACAFEPSAQDVIPWLDGIDIFILPSLFEAFSNSLLEAMARGCCPVASRVGGNGELIRNGETGLLFERGNARELAETLVWLADREEDRRRLATNAAVSASRFTIAAAAGRMAEIYEGFLRRY